MKASTSQSFLRWLGRRLFRRSEETSRPAVVGVRPPSQRPKTKTASGTAQRGADPQHGRSTSVPARAGTTVSSRITDGGPGKNVLIRNKQVREDTGTHDTLKILDHSVLEPDEELGIDPYNTGRFDRAKSWEGARFRK